MKRLKDMVVTVIGLGQIGGSIALRLKQNRAARVVIGCDKRAATMAKAMRTGVVDETVNSITRAVARADLVIVATPIREVIRLLPSVAAHIRPEAVCIDVASTKTDIVRIAESFPCLNFVGGHPLAGSEQEGLEGATFEKFELKTFVLSATSNTTLSATRLAGELVRALGAKPILMSAEDHDSCIALTSAVPHAIALALIHLAAAQSATKHDIEKLIGGSFLGATRVAQSPVHLVSDLLLTNRKPATEALRQFIAELQNLKKLLNSSDKADLRNYIATAHKTSMKLHTGSKRRERSGS